MILRNNFITPPTICQNYSKINCRLALSRLAISNILKITILHINKKRLLIRMTSDHERLKDVQSSVSTISDKSNFQ